jgi:hypothetical protein
MGLTRQIRAKIGYEGRWFAAVPRLRAGADGQQPRGGARRAMGRASVATGKRRPRAQRGANGRAGAQVMCWESDTEAALSSLSPVVQARRAGGSAANGISLAPGGSTSTSPPGPRGGSFLVSRVGHSRERYIARLLLRPRTAVRLIPDTSHGIPCTGFDFGFASPACHPRSALLLPNRCPRSGCLPCTGATRRRHGRRSHPSHGSVHRRQVNPSLAGAKGSRR